MVSDHDNCVPSLVLFFGASPHPHSFLMFPEATGMFFSARFIGDTEQKARNVCEEVNKLRINANLGINANIVDASAAMNFGDMTIENLFKTKVMVVIACNEYGAKTRNGYSSYYELRYAYEKKKPMIVVQLCQNWPPEPSKAKGEIDGAGVMQNSFILGSQGLSRLRWDRREWDAAKCAKEIVEAFQKLQRSDLVVPTNSTNVVPPTSLETESKSIRALDKVDEKEIDICIISLHPPTMLHRLSRNSILIHGMEQDLK